MGRKTSIGLSSLKIGDIEADGSMSLTLAAVGDTVKGSASLESADLETAEFEIEESDDAIEEAVTGGGGHTFTWECYNVHPTQLEKLFGGTISGVAPNEIWNAPDVLPIIEQSVEATTKSDIVISAPRVRLKARLVWALDKAQLAKVAITGTVLKPTKAGLSKLTIGNPA